MYCSNCGEKLLDGQNFCPSCGLQIKIDDEPTGTSKSEAKAPSEAAMDFLAGEIKTTLIIAVIALAIGLVAIPVGLEKDINYARGVLAQTNIETYIQSNKTAHMKTLFTNGFVYGFLILVVGRYLFLILQWSEKRTSAKKSE